MDVLTFRHLSEPFKLSDPLRVKMVHTVCKYMHSPESESVTEGFKRCFNLTRFRPVNVWLVIMIDCSCYVPQQQFREEFVFLLRTMEKTQATNGRFTVSRKIVDLREQGKSFGARSFSGVAQICQLLKEESRFFHSDEQKISEDV